MSTALLLENKVAVISGAASARGIGLTTARKFAQQGAKVVILDLDAQAAADAAASIGPQHLGLACNVADKDACVKAAAAVFAAFGRIDILINNAGITQAIKTLEIDATSWDRILDVNLRGVLYLSQAVIPYMQEQRAGAIACMSSVSAQRGGGILGGAHYSAAKAGVLGLAKAMAREFGPDGIRVNCVTPGLILTDINAGKISEEKMVEIVGGIPLNRPGSVDDVAGAYLFLSSDLSSYITGAVIDVNGGMLIHG
ncbi:SDR family NAD(P)-dependent oxidoreductase [Marinobacterium rhizophilum]|uniref:SDR family oxidoreductase n=1 Tax=Marinobacterium rhizophilum TaxID=420402 RepID=A0ABY5HK76_9GAMM|nr:SDR family NAD(P)-dependent oxidoreductase [Marinobacterium rhizophilum]UTW11674.1 SDR family oxidoreductase [Marinobacterium rhizophilum]